MGEAQQPQPTEQQQPQQPQPVAVKPRKIAIIGTAPSSSGLAPFDDPAWEIWMLKLHKGVPRWDVFFEVHEATEGEKRWPKSYVEFLRSEHRAADGVLKPLFTQGKVLQWPNSKPYPIEHIVNTFGQRMFRGQCRYFTNQVSYMLALAVLQPGVKEIGVWGVDMAQHGVGGRSEYAHQRPSCEFFLGWAAGMGINIYVPPQADLLKCRLLYAFEEDDWRDKLLARQKELQKRIQEAEHLAMAKQREADQLRGAAENVIWSLQWEQMGRADAPH